LRLTSQVDEFKKLENASQGQGARNVESKLALAIALIYGSGGAPVDHEKAKKLLMQAGGHTKHPQLWARVYLGALKGDEEMVNQARKKHQLNGPEVDEIWRKVRLACLQSNDQAVEAPAPTSVTAAAEPTETLPGTSATIAPEAVPLKAPGIIEDATPAQMPAATPAPKPASIPAQMPVAIRAPKPVATPSYVAPHAYAVLLEGSAALPDFTTPAANPQAEVK